MKPVGFAGEVSIPNRMDLLICRLQLKNEAFKPSCQIRTRTLAKSAKSSAHEAEGLEGLLKLPFLEDSTEKIGF